ncbi:Carrier domain-containing protein OS=Streptomyces fumanus OX=67302 GN=GCM10018772_35720 PE=4 SV=1 [Streptomyces fumanus]
MLGKGGDPQAPVMHALEVLGMVHDRPGGPELTLRLAWPERLLDPADAQALLDTWAAMLTGLAAQRGGGRTPSDFPLVTLDQTQVEELEAAVPDLAEVLPVSPLQEGFLFHALFDERTEDVYVEQIVLTLDGPLHPARLRTSWQALIDRHPTLRVGFRQVAGLDRPVQIVHDRADLPWRAEDVSDLDADAAWAESDRIGVEERARRLDVSWPPLLRIALVKLSPNRHRMVMTLHHILLDGWSLPILMRELWACYEAGGSASGLPPAAPYRDYLAWLTRQDKDAARAAWRQALAGADEPTLVAGQTTGTDPVLTRMVGTTADDRLAHALDALARTRGVTLNTVVQAAWAVVVGQLAGRRDVRLRRHGRRSAGGAARHGGHAGPVPEHGPGTGRPRRRAHGGRRPGRIHAQQSALLDHQHLGLTEIQRLAGPGATFDTLMAYENYPGDPAGPPSAEGLTLADTAMRESTNFALALGVNPADGLHLRLDYRPDVFTEDTVRAVTDRLIRVLEQFAADPEVRVGDLDTLMPAERALVTERWNDTARPVSASTLLDLFGQWVARTPDAVAVRAGAEALTYAELDARANRLARHLTGLGVGAESRVGLLLPRGVDSVVAQLGVWRAGGAYVPLDPEYPVDRLAYMVADSGVSVVLAESATAALVPSGVDVMLVDRSVEGSAEPLDTRVTPDQLAYVIYTSGSTGRPRVWRSSTVGWRTWPR